MSAKRELIVHLTQLRMNVLDAEQQLELLDADYAIAQANSAAPDPTDTFEDLAAATAHCQQIESQIEGLDVMCKGEMGEAFAPMVNGMLRPLLQKQWAEADERRKFIQRALEETTQEAQA
jgi:predicted component of type VI protein secretion system